MEQLKMMRTDAQVGEVTFPEGFYMRAYQEGDGKAWCACCIDGSLGVDEISDEAFAKKMLQDERVKPHHIYFLISHTGAVAGTVTYQNGPGEAEGTIHMVGVAKDYLGQRLATPMILYVTQRIFEDGNKTVILTTDDWRIPAIKTYLRAGFAPVHYLPDMAERWERVMENIQKA